MIGASQRISGHPYHRAEAYSYLFGGTSDEPRGVATVGLTEDRFRRDIPDALVMTTNLGVVGFCYNPESHTGKHPNDAFIVHLTLEQMAEIRDKAQKASEQR